MNAPRYFVRLLLAGVIAIATPAYGDFLLDIDGDSASVANVTGGTIRARVVERQIRHSGAVHKRPGRTTYVPLGFEVGMDDSPGLFEWINASFSAGRERRNAAIVDLRQNPSDFGVRHLENAFVSSVEIPALDVASEATCRFSVTLSPQALVYAGPTIAPAPVPPAPQKERRCDNFRFELGDLPTMRVSKIDALTWK